MSTYRTLAIVDDVNACDCCGKSGLKSTVAMERDDGELVHFGSVCATRHAGRPGRVIAREAADVLAARYGAARAEYERSAEHQVEQARLAEANRAGVRPGAPFREFCLAASDAAAAKKRAIALAHGVPVYSF